MNTVSKSEKVKNMIKAYNGKPTTYYLVNLTQHELTKDQYVLNGKELIAVKYKPYNDLGQSLMDFVKKMLNFEAQPEKTEISKRALVLAEYAKGLLNQVKGDNDKVFALIGGAPYLMGPLETALKERGIQPLYAFSKRVSVETAQPDGSVVKTTKFIHEGYIEA